MADQTVTGADSAPIPCPASVTTTNSTSGAGMAQITALGEVSCSAFELAATLKSIDSHIQLRHLHHQAFDEDFVCELASLMRIAANMATTIGEQAANAEDEVAHA